jgi:nitrite reductase/ring-hydroxylating ferredoxin subunit
MTVTTRTRKQAPVRAGSRAELEQDGRLLTKVGAHPVVVFWHEDRAYAIEDRCPHLGFPLHRGTVEAGLVTCHWHHARFDLASGCTLDPFADDAPAYDVAFDGDDILVSPRPAADPVGHLDRRLRDGLEDGLSLVIAKSVLGLLDAGITPSAIVRTGVDFGTTYRRGGWGAGLTVLVAMGNLVPTLDPDDRALALVHGLVFVSNDTRNHPPRFPLDGLGTDGGQRDRLAAWYRRFIDTRSGDAAERVVATALAGAAPLDEVEALMFAAVTDRVFLDGGHTLDFTNKAFEALGLVGVDAAAEVLPTLVRQTAAASRAEESGAWRHPHDLPALAAATIDRLPGLLADGEARRGRFDDVAGLSDRLTADDPEAVLSALEDAVRAGATEEQLGRALAYAAALRILRFHTQNDFGDWDTVHHAFTYANALHQALVRHPTPELLRGVVHGAMSVYLDRFLNVPAARMPRADSGSLDDLVRCWDVQGEVDTAGAIAYGYVRGGGDPSRLVAALGHALLAEDAEFHWFQLFEAGVRQFHAWPPDSEEAALILTALARFLAAHTPTRRELPRVVDIARRLRRGEDLYEESDTPGVA